MAHQRARGPVDWLAGWLADDFGQIMLKFDSILSCAHALVAVISRVNAR